MNLNKVTRAALAAFVPIVSLSDPVANVRVAALHQVRFLLYQSVFCFTIEHEYACVFDDLVDD